MNYFPWLEAEEGRARGFAHREVRDREARLSYYDCRCCGEHWDDCKCEVPCEGCGKCVNHCECRGAA